MKKNDSTKQAVIDRVAGGKPWKKAVGHGQAKYDVGGEIVHTRFCSSGASSSHYKFNINPNTLRSDHELWICGDESHYYLIPIERMQEMYDDPGAYQDKTHQNIRVVTVDSSYHTATYAAGGKKLGLRSYLRATL